MKYHPPAAQVQPLDAVALAAQEQPENLAFKEEVNQADEHAQGEKPGSQVGNGVEHIAKLLVEQAKEQHRHDRGQNVQHAPGDFALFLSCGHARVFLFHVFHSDSVL